MNQTRTVMCAASKMIYEEAQMDIIEFACNTDILTTSLPIDENQGEWDPQ